MGISLRSNVTVKDLLDSDFSNEEGGSTVSKDSEDSNTSRVRGDSKD
jgi:hypothetical protein